MRSDYLAGYPVGIEFKSKPEGWKNTRDHGFYLPAKSNKEVTKEFQALPSIHTSEANEILGFRMQMVGNRYYQSPGLSVMENFALVSVANACDFTPNEEMTEILESEFIKLQNEAEAKEPA